MSLSSVVVPQWHWTPFLSTFLEHAGGRSPGLGLSNDTEIKKNRCFLSCSVDHVSAGSRLLCLRSALCARVFLLPSSATPDGTHRGGLRPLLLLAGAPQGLSGPGTPMLDPPLSPSWLLGKSADPVASSCGGVGGYHVLGLILGIWVPVWRSWAGEDYSCGGHVLSSGLATAHTCPGSPVRPGEAPECHVQVPLLWPLVDAGHPRKGPQQTTHTRWPA